ncbi:hypothetical protein GCM10027614_71040 [Micromonospora vulcania]
MLSAAPWALTTTSRRTPVRFIARRIERTPSVHTVTGPRGVGAQRADDRVAAVHRLLDQPDVVEVRHDGDL